MKVAIRVDASSQIGTGHFMRCLTLADALKQRDTQVRFISRFLPAHMQDMLATKGHEAVLLDGATPNDSQNDLAHSRWLGTSQQSDAQACLQALSDGTWDWLVVDHYALDAHWESMLRPSASNILVIDDIADRQHDCDVLLDQNYYSDMQTRYHDKVPAHCRLLLGPKYALLRDEFRQLRQQVQPRAGLIKRVLVFFGGVDVDDYTGRAIEALSGLDAEGMHVDVVIGEQHPRRKNIESACAKHRFDCHVQTDRMAELMAAADFSIGAGGSAIWERCCLGLPALIVSTADNQRKQVADAACAGLIYAPQLKGDLGLAMQRHLGTLSENSHLLQAISSAAMQVADGRGVLRVMGSMGCSGMTIRLACQDDMEHLYQWRNHASIRVVSQNSGIISWEDHKTWFTALLSSTDRVLLIGEREGVPMGVVRFDMQDDEAEVSIYVVPGITEAGVGSDLLRRAEKWLAANRSGIGKVRAKVLAGNERSHGLFIGSGYQVESTAYFKELQ